MSLSPPCRWAGGKSRMAPEIIRRIGAIDGTYYEPMVGMGAVFLGLRDSGFTGPVVLGDAAGAVRGVWTALQSDHDSLLTYLRGLGDVLTVERHAVVRDVYNALEEHSTLRAAHLIWLLAASHGGVYRVNAAGEFNVGPQHDRVWTPERPTRLPLPNAALLRDLNAALVGVEVLEHALPLVHVFRRLQAGDVVYLDPPYTDTFAYGAENWNLNQLRDLVYRLEQLVAERPGVRVFLTETDRAPVRELLTRWEVSAVDLGSSVSRAATKARKEIIASLGG